MKEKSERDCQIEKGIFGLEITTTEACNFKCAYCFERCNQDQFVQLAKPTLNAQIIEDKVYELLESDWFKKQYDGIKLILWGGEPFLNESLCKNLFNAFMHENRVCFFVYTNGSNINRYIDILKELRVKSFINKTPKVTIQISYDGNPIHDLNRKDKHGLPTTDYVTNAIYLLDKYCINFGLKATMPWWCFVFLPEAWDEYKGLYNLYKTKYSMTVDYYNVEFRKYRKEIEDTLIKIAQREIKFYNEHGHFLSNIFKTNRAFCATGKSMAVVDVNGDVYYCHGSIYSKCSDDFKYTNIFSKKFINSIEKANKFFYNNHIEPEECKNCISTSCLRCNVRKYEISNEETFLDRWFDYPAQKELCEYYKLVGKIGSAMKKFLKE